MLALQVRGPERAPTTKGRDMRHDIRVEPRHELTSYACSCGWESVARKDAEQARLESCRHLARVLRFGSVTIGGDAYLVPKA